MRLKISLCMLIFFTTVAFAQKPQRVAYIDMEYILSNVPEYLDAQNTLDSKVTKWRAELDKLTRYIEKLKTELGEKFFFQDLGIPEQLYYHFLEYCSSKGIEDMYLKKNVNKIKKILSKKNINKHGYFKHSKINKLLENIDNNNFYDNNKIWIFYCFQQWWDLNF